MSISFSRSMRSLNADSLRPSLVGLVVAILLLVAWATWFFLAQITLYETGQIVDQTRDGTIVANFPPEAQGRIYQGQSALLRFDAAPESQTGPISAIVTDVANSVQEGQLQVELFALPDDTASQAPLQNGLTGQVEIEIEHISPATLVMRSSGQLFDTQPVSLDSQDNSD